MGDILADKALALIVIDECLAQEDQTQDPNGRKKKARQKKRLSNKQEYSNENVLKKIRYSEQLEYKSYLGMDDACFENLLERVRTKISKQDTLMRAAIPAATRLAVTLQFLATGNSFEELKFKTAVSPQAIGGIVVETCKAINGALKDFLQLPASPNEWYEVARKFAERTYFPHCLGAIAGRHIYIKKPANSGSLYFNYNKRFSIVLVALVNADAEFLMVDVGTNGRVSDGEVLERTKFFQKLENKELNNPTSAMTPSGRQLPFVFIADETFALREDVLIPYGHANLNAAEEMLNERFRTAQITVANAFNILSSRFRVLLTIMQLAPEKATEVTLTCCYLHNFLQRQSNTAFVGRPQPQPTPNNTIGFIPLERTFDRNATIPAEMVRLAFCQEMYAYSQRTN